MPSNVLTINGGSSSIRFAVYEAGETRPRLDGKIDRIGLRGTNLVVNDPAGTPPRIPRRLPVAFAAALGGLDTLVFAAGIS